MKKQEGQAEPDALQPVTVADMGQMARLLSRLPVIWPHANAEERKTLCQAMLERVYVRSNDIVAIQPCPELWALFMSVVGSGPDGRPVSDKLPQIHLPCQATPITIAEPATPPAWLDDVLST